MKRKGLLYFFLLGFTVVQAQSNMQLLLPNDPVVAGEAFQAQYVIENAQTVSNFTPPSFSPFTVVAGPNIYTGYTNKGQQTIRNQNYVYTLVANRRGVYPVQAARAVINGSKKESNAGSVTVVEKKETEPNRYADAIRLLPGENVQEKIKKNLFLKVKLDKTSCVVGQPVVATFQLYTRLQSRSELIKNPGFYGFSVYDMISTEDKIKEEAMVNGSRFDVHTIRKVQLYPLQPGKFTIDAMELSNSIKFIRGHKAGLPEPEVLEQMVEGGREEEAVSADEEIVETRVTSEPVQITVRPLPSVRPDSFTGATGLFKLNMMVEKGELARNEQGFLRVELTGKGNFIQLTAPLIQWPEGIEGFDATLKDTLDTQAVPLTGNRIFRYGFVAVQPGSYVIPGLVFSYFDTDSNRFKTIRTNPVTVVFSRDTISVKAVAGPPLADKNSAWWWIGLLAAGFVLLVITGLLWKRQVQRKKRTKKETEETTETKQLLREEKLCAAQWLQPALMALQQPDKSFFITLNKCCWDYLQYRYQLSAREMNRQGLLQRVLPVQEKVLLQQWLSIIEQCETEIYTGANTGADRKVLWQQALSLAENWDDDDR